MRAYRGHWKGKNFVWKIYCYFPQKIMASSLSTLRAEYNWRAISRTLPSNLKLPLISEEIFNLSNLRVLPAEDKGRTYIRFWWKYLQKVIAKSPQISDEKDKFFFHWYFFFSFFKGSKVITQRDKTLFFSSEIWGHFAFTFCRYCLQNLFLDAI